MARTSLMIGGALVATATGIVAGQYIYRHQAASPSAASTSATTTWDQLAPRYDGMVSADEWMTGVTKRRGSLLTHAHGHTLELATGTARNLPYYPYPSLTSLTLVDRSAAMIAESRKKWMGVSDTASVPVEFRIIDADDQQSIQSLPSHHYDTIVDTFGLCSYNSPKAVMAEMTRLLKTKNRSVSSRSMQSPVILLLEHGLTSKNSPSIIQSLVATKLDTYLHNHSHQHYARFGCEWNRDMDSLIEYGVSELGWRVIERRTFHFGTGQYLVVQVNHREVNQ